MYSRIRVGATAERMFGLAAMLALNMILCGAALGDDGAIRAFADGIRATDLEQLQTLRLESPRQHAIADDPGTVTTVRRIAFDGASGPERAQITTDLYDGLPTGGFYWFYVPGPYFALDDGTMAPGAVASGGGEVTAFEFAYGAHADFDGDTLQPVVVLSFWNAPPDPVGDASDPVVDPLNPVASITVTFNPITLPTAGNYVITSGILDLALAGLEFDLDATFYVEVIPFKLQGGVPVFDPNVFAAFSTGPITLGVNQDNMWSDVWVRQGCSNFVSGDGDGFYDHPAELDWGGCAGFENQSPVRLIGTPNTSLTLEVDDGCLGDIGDIIEVELWMRNLPQFVTGYQAFLAFDDTVLQYRGDLSVYDDAVFSAHIQGIATAEIAAGELNVDGSVDFGGAGTNVDTRLAILRFEALQECVSTSVTFRTTHFESEVSHEGDPLPTNPIASRPFYLDNTPPAITCPADVTLECDEPTAPATGGGGWNHKMHFPQLPDPDGWDVDAGLVALADDWQCSETGPIQDIHIWGSWHDDLVGSMTAIVLQISEDIPAGTDGIPFSRPGTPLWTYWALYAEGDFAIVEEFPQSWQGYYSPSAFDPIVDPMNHQRYFRYDITIPDPNQFEQQQGTIYWLQATPTGIPYGALWGWKTSTDHFNDTAVYNDWLGAGTWQELLDPISSEPLSLAFVITDGPMGTGATGVATATDNCDPDPVITHSDVEDWGGCGGYTGTITRTWTATDDCGNSSSCVQTITVMDTTPPVITCPPDITENADAGGCSLSIDPGTATATDNCDGSPVITWSRDDGKTSLSDPYDAVDSPITITWTATDECSNGSSCDQIVTVNAVNELDLVIWLDGVNVATTRCIHFQTDDCTGFDVDLMFNSSGFFASTIEIPCGNWTSVCAKDEQHTLWDSTTLTPVGTGYQADFTLHLTGGDTDNDGDVDINDVTWFMFTYANPAAAGGCPWDGTRDADFSNNGVVATEDYTFLTDNWLSQTECACTMMASLGKRSVNSRLALGGVASAVEATQLPAAVAEVVDLNRDGIVDHADVREFEQLHGLPDVLSRTIRAASPNAGELGELRKLP